MAKGFGHSLLPAKASNWKNYIAEGRGQHTATLAKLKVEPLIKTKINP